MIHDNLVHSGLYGSVHPLFKEAFAYLENFDPETPDGKFQLRGTDLTGIVQRYQTKPAAQKQFEAHREYIDIQYIVEGTEILEYAQEGSFPVKVPFNPEKDVELYSDSPNGSSSLQTGPGEYCIFFPHDVHKPGCSIGANPASVCKVVLKIRAAATGN